MTIAWPIVKLPITKKKNQLLNYPLQKKKKKNQHKSRIVIEKIEKFSFRIKYK
jgi:hypothetical protein